MNDEMLSRQMPLADLLRSYRRTAQFTQEELAAEAGVSVRTISGLERQVQHVPYRETIRLLADALKLTTEERAALTRAALSSRSPASVATNSVPVRQVFRQPNLAMNQLRVPATSFIGRALELATGSDLLRDRNVPLLTLVGPPGVGKTRLSVEIAARVASSFADGVCFVALAPLYEPLHVALAIAEAVGVVETGTLDVNEKLIAALSSRQMLIVLDNFEQVQSAAPLIAELLARCANVKLLVTSREALGLQAEHLFAVAPLALPEESHQFLLLHELAEIPAIELFVSRVRQVRPTFQLTSQNAAVVAAICRKLDGLPLALELAAAQVKLLSPQILFDRLTTRLALLTNGARDLPERQRTLRRALRWSYDLLDESERVIFRRMAVFAGGATVEAVEAVCCGYGAEVRDSSRKGRPFAMLEQLTSLFDKSLLVSDERVGQGGDEVQVRMLETIREYAWEQLAAHGEADEAERAHARYYVTRCESTEMFLDPLHIRELGRYKDDLANFRAALHWSLESCVDEDVELGLRLATALGPFWYAAGYLGEGMSWLQRLLQRGQDETAGGNSVSVRGKALYVAGWIAEDRGEQKRAANLLLRSARLYRRTSELATLSEVLNRLGNVKLQQGKAQQAETIFSESLGFSRQIGNSVAIAISFCNLGAAMAHQQRYEQAEKLMRRSFALYSHLGKPWGVAFMLGKLGDLARERGDYASSRKFLRESLALARWDDDGVMQALALGMLGRVAYEQGEYREAENLWQERLALYAGLGHRYGEAFCLLALANLKRVQGQHIAAIELLSATLTRFGQLSVTSGVAESLDGLASIATTLGRTDEATWLSNIRSLWRGAGELRLISQAVGVAAGLSAATTL